MNNILFSIIVPTYNRAHLISHTLDSVRNQDFKNFELIIVDDGSNDNTKSIIENYIYNYELKNFHYYYKNNEERGAARNYGISKASGKWITFLDSDDIFYNNHLFLASDFILKNADIDVFHSAYEFRNQKNELIRKVIYPKNNNLNSTVLKGNLFSCFGIFIKVDVFEELKFEENRQLSGTEDWLLWLQIASRYQIHFQPHVSGYMIQHDGRSVLNFTEEQLLCRTNLLIEKLRQDNFFMTKFGTKVVKNIEAHMLTYSALHLVLSHQRHNAIEMFLKGIKLNPLELFSMRTLAFIKYLLLN